jgi:hypothetical protein
VSGAGWVPGTALPAALFSPAGSPLGGAAGYVLLQLLYAIGLWLMIPLRRLDTRLLVGVALGWLVLEQTYIASAAALALLYPVCVRAHPRGWAQYL